LLASKSNPARHTKHQIEADRDHTSSTNKLSTLQTARRSSTIMAPAARHLVVRRLRQGPAPALLMQLLLLLLRVEAAPLQRRQQQLRLQQGPAHALLLPLLPAQAPPTVLLQLLLPLLQLLRTLLPLLRAPPP
jgi:hypothetical protein